jgi:hypothetical protein
MIYSASKLGSWDFDMVGCGSRLDRSGRKLLRDNGGVYGKYRFGVARPR